MKNLNGLKTRKKRNSKQNNQRRRRAFSLAELMVVISVIGILSLFVQSRVDVIDDAKMVGVQSDFLNFQMASETVLRRDEAVTKENINKYLGPDLELLDGAGAAALAAANPAAGANPAVATQGVSKGVDPWGTQYIWEVPNLDTKPMIDGEVDYLSVGPDMQRGTPDDIVLKVWSQDGMVLAEVEGSDSFGVGGGSGSGSGGTGGSGGPGSLYPDGTANPSDILKSISVIAQPTKTKYAEGENFDPAGMKLKLTFSDGHTVEKTSADAGFKVLDGNSLRSGKSSVRVSYTVGGVSRTATVPITVTKPEVNISSIVVSNPPFKTKYVEGETFSSNGMKITINYSDGHKETVSRGFTIKDGANLTVGKTSVIVEYTKGAQTLSTNFSPITVVKKTAVLQKIEVTTQPTKLVYNDGETFDPTGMKLTLTFSDGKTEVVDTGFRVVDGNLFAGKNSVLISYTKNGVIKTTTVAITVNGGTTGAATLSSVSINTLPTKTKYVEGENFETAGLKLTLLFSDGKTEVVSSGFVVADGNNLVAGKTSVTVSYERGGVVKTVAVPITVEKASGGTQPQPQPTGTKLADLKEGDIIKLSENGVPVEFYVAKHNYEPGLNGNGRTLVVRKDLHSLRSWSDPEVSEFSKSSISGWLNGEYKNLLDPEIQRAISVTKFYSGVGALMSGNTDAEIAQNSIFLLSCTELGFSEPNNGMFVEGSTLPIASTLKIAKLNGQANEQWARSFDGKTSVQAWMIRKDGTAFRTMQYARFPGARPAFTLPDTTTIDASGHAVPAGNLSAAKEGDIVTLNENGNPVEFYVAKHNYEPALNGNGRTLLVRKDCYEDRKRNETNVNTWSTMTMDAWLNGEYKQILDVGIQQAMGLTKFKYTNGNGSNAVSDLVRPVFLLSATELGQADTWFNVEGSALPIANILQKANANGSPTTQWTRSPNKNSTYYAAGMKSTGIIENVNSSHLRGTRPAFTLPDTIKIDETGRIVVPAPKGELLGTMAEGATIKLNENGALVEFYVAKHNYEPTLNGDGRTLLVRKYCYTSRQWHSTNNNAYATSDIDKWLNGTYKTFLDANVKKAMGATTFDFTIGNANNNKGNLSRAVFLLSLNELGLQNSSYFNAEGSKLPTADMLRTAKIHSTSSVVWWTRTPYKQPHIAMAVTPSMSTVYDYSNTCDKEAYVRPVFTLPDICRVDANGNVVIPDSEPKAISSFREGDILKLRENGVPVEFYVAKHNYEPVLNGQGRTLLVRKDVHSKGQWHTTNVNAYATSAMDAWLNGEYKNLLDQNVQSSMGTTKFKYTPGNGSFMTVNLDRPIFQLSMTELGCSGSPANKEGSALPISNALKVAKLNSIAVNQWTRTPDTTGGGNAIYIDSVGVNKGSSCSDTLGIRPAFTLLDTAQVDQYGCLVPPPPKALSDYPEGSTVKIKEGGQPVEFYVAKHNYESGLNGNGRTLLVRKEIHSQGKWHWRNESAYATSTIDTWLNNDYKNLLEPGIKTAIGTTKFQYTPGNGNWNVSNLDRAVFLLSATEIGDDQTIHNVEGSRLPIYNILLTNKEGNNFWTRTLDKNRVGKIFVYDIAFGQVSSDCTNSSGYRPCFTLPDTIKVDIANSVIPN